MGNEANNVTVKRQVGRPQASSNAKASSGELLNVAAELFAEVGAARISIAMVAKRAGYTPAAVHYHFKNREILIDAIVRSKLIPLINHAWSAMDMAKSDPIETTLEITRRLYKLGIDNPWFPPVWLTEVVAGDGELKKSLLARLPQDKIALFIELLANAQREGKINPFIAPNFILISILGMTMFALASKPFWSMFEVGGDELSEESVLRHVEGMLRGGLSHAHLKNKAGSHLPFFR